MNNAHKDMREVQNPEDIPQFRSEAEEAEFWAAHSLGDWFFEEAEPVSENILPPVRPQTSLLSELLDDAILGRLKELAYHRGAEPLALVTEFVADRLDQEELRESMPSASLEGENGASGEPVARSPESTLRNDIEGEARRFIEENEPLLDEGTVTVLGRVFVQGANMTTDLSAWAVEASNQAERVIRTLTEAIKDPSTPAPRLQDLESERTRALELHEHRGKVFQEFVEFLDRVSAQRQQRIDEGDRDDVDEDDPDNALVQEAERIVHEAALRAG